MDRSSRSPVSPGLLMVPVGIALTLLARAFDGFVGGLFLGAGLMVLVLSAVLVGARIGAARSEGEGWLPSRDGDG